MFTRPDAIEKGKEAAAEAGKDGFFLVRLTEAYNGPTGFVEAQYEFVLSSAKEAARMGMLGSVAYAKPPEATHWQELERIGR